MIEPFVAFNGITAALYGDIAHQNLKMVNKIMHSQVDHFQNLTKATRPEDIVKVHTEWVATMAPSYCEHAQGILDTVLQSAQDYNKWFEQGFSQVSRESKNSQEYFARKKSQKEAKGC